MSATIHLLNGGLLDAPEDEPESIRQFRLLAESLDIRILLGEIFLKLAQTDNSDNEHVHYEALERMANGRDFPGIDQARILMRNLDLLRCYDQTRQRREYWRQIAKAGGVDFDALLKECKKTEFSQGETPDGD